MAIVASPIVQSKGILDLLGDVEPLQERAVDLCRRLLEIHSLSHTIVGARDVTELRGLLAAHLRDLFPEESVHFCMREGETYRRLHVCGPRVFGREDTYSLSHGFMGEVLRSGCPLWIKDTLSCRQTVPFMERGATFAPRSILILPLTTGGSVTGALELVSSRPDRFSESDYHLGSILSAHISCSLESILTRQALVSTKALLSDHDAKLTFLNHQLQELAHTDECTGLFNRRRLLEQLDAEIERARRYDETLSCLMIDIDHFKQINDSYGHQAGDEVLRQFGALMKKSLRVTDFIARYGGEEFTVLLPRADGTAARHVADVLRRRIKSHEFVLSATGNSIHITASIGIVTCASFEQLDRQQVIMLADKLLYIAKNSGRDRICFSLSEIRTNESQDFGARLRPI